MRRPPIRPGQTIGILGGGQLGRMLALSARQLGMKVWLYAPEYEAPARGVADRTFTHEWNDKEALLEFATGVDVATFEFENIPEESGAILESHTIVRPRTNLLAIAQDRRLEKAWLKDQGFPVAPFAVVDAPEDCEAAAAAVGFPGILKTARLGYDGKGQARVHSLLELRQAFERFHGVPCIFEGLVQFVAEASIIVARSPSGECALYGPMRNHHEDHILESTIIPGGFAPEVEEAAQSLGVALAKAIDLEGLICVELFVLASGELLVNELAPRPHNSGHWTMDGALTSQFEQQIRAICDLPLGSVALRSPTAMLNLLGDLWGSAGPDFAAALQDPEIRLHLYGKSVARKGRKMGHLSLSGQDADLLLPRLHAARRAFGRLKA